MLSKLKELFKDFKFTVIKMEPGNEMIRTSWFGRHDYVPYVRLDFWKIGFRISYDPNYFVRFEDEYRDRLNKEQLAWAIRFIKDYKEHDDSPLAPINQKLYRDLCHELEDKDWV